MMPHCHTCFQAKITSSLVFAGTVMVTSSLYFLVVSVDTEYLSRIRRSASSKRSTTSFSFTPTSALAAVVVSSSMVIVCDHSLLIVIRRWTSALWTSPRMVDTQLRGYNHPGRSIMAKKRRTYTPEFKAEAVKLVTEQGYSVAEAARSLGIHETLLRSWKQAVETQGDQAFPGHGKLPPFEEELRRLRAENKRLRAERDILKKATALFAQEAM